jgi:magnesium chelatase family protein
MLTKIYGAAVEGIDAIVITIEVNSSRGCQFYLVGLPDSAVKESHQRIISALQECGYKLPIKSTVVNMAPAYIKKEGSAYDLPIAMGLLAANEMIVSDKLDRYMIMGELSLDGSIQPIKGALPIAIKAYEEHFDGLIVPQQNVREAGVVNKLKVYGVKNIREVIDFFTGVKELEPVQVNTREEFEAKQTSFDYDFSDVKGQENVKRALEVAAAGGHNIIMIGAPGSGKSMMAKRLPSILPPLSLRESLETTKIHSVAGTLDRNTSLITTRPFRDPHHTISQVAMVGGGTFPQPGEISLAHNGVLFLDELPEFNRSVLEVLRQPLEDRKISISRIKYSVDYPAGFMLVASMNPCPCGYYNHPTKQCTCMPGQVQKYLNKISGPLLDRIDIQIEIVPVPFEKISDSRRGETSDAIRERVIKARKIQENRYSQYPHTHCNAQMTSKLLERHAHLDEEELTMLKTAMEKFNLSARAYDRILKVSRTIADLDESENIRAEHLSEAINYRNLDRENWAENRGIKI